MAHHQEIIRVIHETENKELVLIELQGSLDHSIEKDFYGMYLGKLEEKNNGYILTIGNHILEGKKVTLKDPYIICSKYHKNGDDKKHFDTVKIRKIIKTKINFNLRPTPILE